MKKLTTLAVAVLLGLIALAGSAQSVLVSTPGKATGGGFIERDGSISQLATLLIRNGASAGGKATFGFAVQFNTGDPGPTGNLEYHDHGAGVTIKASAFTSLVIGPGPCGPNTHATFTGTATVNGTAGKSLDVAVDDCGEPGSAPGSGPDTFSIGTEGYAAAGFLVGGNIQVLPPIPINHIIVLMQENRSFDHYLGQLHNFDPTLDVEPLPPDASNPDPTDPDCTPDPSNPECGRIQAFHQTKLCEVADLEHGWNGTHEQWNNGAMDGFTTTNVRPQDPTGSRAMGFYTEQELPFYYTLYSTFAMADRYFSSLPGPTFPNRFYLLAATSWVDTRNTNEAETRNRLPQNPLDFAQRTIFNLLDEAGISWKVYFSEEPFAFEFAYVRNHAPGNVVPIDDYFIDAQMGTLPQVAFVDPDFNLTGLKSKNVQSDEHPPANVQAGQEFVADVINALMASPQWKSSAFFLIYDEHGGYFDHVPPPAAIPPDNHPPSHDTPGENDDPGTGFALYGIRLPAVVVSPFAKEHFVSHVVYDHTSVLRFIETRFDLPALTNRDANADPMLDLFDFETPAFEEPPVLPAATADRTRPECGDP